MYATHPTPRSQAALRAFTLIELLTVIAIIGILAAILIPTVGKVRYSARNAQCMAYLREWGRVVQLYANDHKGYYFTQNAAGSWSGGGEYTPYFSSNNTQNVRQCPAMPSYALTDGPTYIIVQGSISGNIATLAPADKIPLNRASSPSQYLLLSDSIRHANGSMSGENTADIDARIAPMFNLAATSNHETRHKAGPINGVFGDGSMKRITVTPAGSGDRNSIYEMRTTWFQLN